MPLIKKVWEENNYWIGKKTLSNLTRCNRQTHPLKLIKTILKGIKLLTITKKNYQFYLWFMYNHLLYCNCILQYGLLIYLAWRLESLGTTRTIPFLNRRGAAESPEVCRLRFECNTWMVKLLYLWIGLHVQTFLKKKKPYKLNGILRCESSNYVHVINYFEFRTGLFKWLSFVVYNYRGGSRGRMPPPH